MGKQVNYPVDQPEPPSWLSSPMILATSVILGILSSLITISNFLHTSFSAFIPDSIVFLNIFSLILFLAAISTFGIWKKHSRNPDRSPDKLVLYISAALTLAGVATISLSFILANLPNGASTNDRTLMESIEPTPQKFQVQRDGSTATVSGVEMQAKSCPLEYSSFAITALEQGDRVSFSLKGYPGDSASGSYAVTAQGAGISENYRISDGAIQRIHVTAQENGDLDIKISAQHRPELGSSCDTTNEVLAIDDAVLN